ncbi:hypothetical protein Pelo_13908 [Pelomyxa schiedti]|nr:hypothetical protein Pelo_13908 [Pelomyxa schiedti]
MFVRFLFFIGFSVCEGMLFDNIREQPKTPLEITSENEGTTLSFGKAFSRGGFGKLYRACSMCHDNIPTFLMLSVTLSHVYIVMSFIDGITLEAMVKQSRLPEMIVRKLATELLKVRLLSNVHFPVEHFSTDAQQLIRAMLQPDPDKRASLDEIIQHRWVHLRPARIY